MDVREVLRFTDDLVFAKTGKHLDDLQKTVLRGVWQGRTYTQIAEESAYSDGYIRDIASKLLKVLSKLLRENVNKSNFRSTMERYNDCNVSNFNDVVNFGNINNFCTETLHPPKTPQTSTEDNTQQKLDLRDAPDIKTFYNCTAQLTTLENAIAHQNCRLLTITGMSGTGKSAIACHLIPLIQTQFDRIIWRSLRTSPPLEATLKNLIQFLSNQPEINLPANTDAQLSILIEYLRDRPSLIILDDVQQILNSSQLAGNYK